MLIGSVEGKERLEEIGFTGSGSQGRRWPSAGHPSRSTAALPSPSSSGGDSGPQWPWATWNRSSPRWTRPHDRTKNKPKRKITQLDITFKNVLFSNSRVRGRKKPKWKYLGLLDPRLGVQPGLDKLRDALQMGQNPGRSASGRCLGPHFGPNARAGFVRSTGCFLSRPSAFDLCRKNRL